MPSTRSASRAVKAAGNLSPVETPVSEEENGKKRKAKGAATGVPTKSKRAKPVEIAKREPNPNAPKFTLDIDPDAQVIPAKLAFSFDEAKAHLIAVDSRFKELFDRVKCKPFQDLEPVDPFRCVFVISEDFSSP
jgi:DNA-3-methyladenine glycosylase II